MSTQSTAVAKTDPSKTATEIAPKQSALTLMASRLNVEPTELVTTLKATVFKGASDAEFQALVITASEYQLNPILKEIYAFPQKGGGIVPVVGIDGWLKIVNRQPNFDGLEVLFSQDGKEATCKIFLKDRQHPVVVSEHLDECFRPTEPWKNMPRRMLRHKAIMQCARVAFGIGGIHDDDEARDISGRSPGVLTGPDPFERKGKPLGRTDSGQPATNKEGWTAQAEGYSEQAPAESGQTAEPSAEEDPEVVELSPQEELVAKCAGGPVTYEQVEAYALSKKCDPNSEKGAKRILNNWDQVVEEIKLGPVKG